jgi:hypothetical protein
MWDDGDDFDPATSFKGRRDDNSVWKLTLLAGTVLVASLFLWVLTRDSSPVWDEDLLADHVDVPAQATQAPPRASARLQQVLNAASALPTIEGVRGQTPAMWSTQLLTREAARYRAIVEQVRDLVAETDWAPAHASWVEQDLGNHPGWPGLTLACLVSSILDVRQQHHAAAVSLGLDLMTLGHSFQSITVLPSYYARALELHRAGCISLATALHSAAISAEDLKRAQADMEACAPVDKTLQKAMSDYYRYEKELLVGALTADRADALIADMMKVRPGRLFFKPQATLSLMADTFRELRGEVLKPSYSRSTVQLTARVGSQGRPRAFPGHPNFSGIRHANQRLWPYVDIIDSQTLARARHELVRTLFAIRRHVVTKGSLPATLEILVQDQLLPALPSDPFTGLPLSYVPGRLLLYSVGSDHKDDQGQGMGHFLEDDREPTLLLSGN